MRISQPLRRHRPHSIDLKQSSVFALKRQPRWFVLGALVAWAAVTAGGLLWLWDRASASGPASRAPADWPTESRLPLATGRHTLVMFLHPRCACSRASLAELGRALAACGDRVAAHVLLVRPKGAQPGWERTGLWEAAQQIPGVNVVAGHEGQEASQFGAQTSGQVVLYDSAGQLLFQGGITGARGHEGDNAGRTAVVEWVIGGHSPVRQTRVFGCGLSGPDALAEPE